MPGNVRPITDERDGLLSYLDHQREVLRLTAYGLSDDQVRATPSASPLSVGGLIKHVASVEQGWIDTTLQRVRDSGEDYESTFRLEPDETLADVLGFYHDVAEETAAVIAAIADLGQPVPVPRGVPWFPQDVEAWSVRWVLLHLIEETARHAGHADIVRECLDGATAFPRSRGMADHSVAHALAPLDHSELMIQHLGTPAASRDPPTRCNVPSRATTPSRFGPAVGLLAGGLWEQLTDDDRHLIDDIDDIDSVGRILGHLECVSTRGHQRHQLERRTRDQCRHTAAADPTRDQRPARRYRHDGDGDGYRRRPVRGGELCRREDFRLQLAAGPARDISAQRRCARVLQGNRRHESGRPTRDRHPAAPRVRRERPTSCGRAK